MNCLLFGLGPHAKRIYIPYLEHSKNIDTVIVVDFKSEEGRLRSIISNLTKKYDLILLDNYIKNFTVLPHNYENILKKYIYDYSISKVIISTEPRSHKMYIDFSLKYGLDVMCDKPITAPLYTNTEHGYTAISDIEKNREDSIYLGQNENPRFEILNDFTNGEKSHSSIEKHKESVEILGNIYKEISKNCENEDFRFSVEGIIECNNKVLLCKRQSNLKIAPGIWNVPAGKVQFNEGLEDAIIRETKEETGLEINNVTYLDYHFINKKHKRLVFTYHAKVPDDVNIKIDKTEFSEYKWVVVDEIEKFHTLNQHLVKWIKIILRDKDE